jgi:hypothetical protein
MNKLVGSLVIATLALAASSTLATRARAEGMTLTEQQYEAQRLTALCTGDQNYLALRANATQGSMRAFYEAAAYLTECFYDNVDPRYPAEQKQKWQATIQEDRALAQQYQ